MDSMMAVEIKQTLEREFQVFLTPQDIRGMTFSKLQDLAAQTENEPAATAQGIIYLLLSSCDWNATANSLPSAFTLYTKHSESLSRREVQTSWPLVAFRGFVHHSLWTPYLTITFHREANHSLLTLYPQIRFRRVSIHTRGPFNQIVGNPTMWTSCSQRW